MPYKYDEEESQWGRLRLELASAAQMLCLKDVIYWKIFWERVSHSPGYIGTADPSASVVCTSGFTVRQKGGQGLMQAMSVLCQVSSTSNPSFLIQLFFLNEGCTMAQWVEARASQAWPADLDPQNQRKEGWKERTNPHFSSDMYTLWHVPKQNLEGVTYRHLPVHCSFLNILEPSHHKRTITLRHLNPGESPRWRTEVKSKRRQSGNGFRFCISEKCNSGPSWG